MCKIFSPNSRDGVLTHRPGSLSLGVFLSLPMSHVFIGYAANSQPTQYPCVGRDSDPNTMLHCCFQCSGLTSHESHRASDDPIRLASPPGVSPGRSLCDFPRQCLNRWFVVTSECNSVVPKLIDELRCSLRNAAKFSCSSRNQRRSRRLVSPFTDDQHKSHLFFRSRNP